MHGAEHNCLFYDAKLDSRPVLVAFDSTPYKSELPTREEWLPRQELHRLN